jgi:hypothetical protein
MKVGSLVERVRHLTLIERVTGKVVEGFPGKVPKNVPVVVSGWRFADKGAADLYYISIEGYEVTKKQDGGLTHEWYSPSLFIELQPPMDLSFIEEMQQPKVKEITPCHQK